jgi:hypothetical protein
MRKKNALDPTFLRVLSDSPSRSLRTRYQPLSLTPVSPHWLLCSSSIPNIYHLRLHWPPPPLRLHRRGGWGTHFPHLWQPPCGDFSVPGLHHSHSHRSPHAHALRCHARTDGEEGGDLHKSQCRQGTKEEGHVVEGREWAVVRGSGADDREKR